MRRDSASFGISFASAAIAGCIGLLACLAVRSAYPVAVAFPDTADYLQMGRSIVIDLARPPLTGLLLLAARASGNTSVSWLSVMTALYVCCAASIAWTGTVILGNAQRGLALSLLWMLLDCLLMSTVFATTWLLSDALYTLLIVMGCVWAGSGMLQSRVSMPTLAVGCLLLGLSGSTRPLGAAYLLWIPLLCILYRPLRRVSLRHCALLLCLLLLPAMLWKGFLLRQYGIVGENPYVSRHLATQASQLLQPNDSVLDNPEANAALHQAVRYRSLPPAFAFPDPFGRTPDHILGRIMAVYASQTQTGKTWQGDIPATEWPAYTLETAAIGSAAGVRMILLHPMLWLSHVRERYWQHFNPASMLRYPHTMPLSDPAATYAWSASVLSEAATMQLRLPPVEAIAERINMTAADIIRRWSVDGPVQFVLRLLPWLLPVAVHLIGICSLAACVIALRRRRMCRAIGAMGLLLFAMAVLHALPFAAVSALPNMRYALPAAAFSHLLIAACLALAPRGIQHVAAHAMRLRSTLLTRNIASR